MQLTLMTWNSYNINDGTYFISWIPVGQLVNLSARGVSVPRSVGFPYLSGTVLQEHFFSIVVKIAETQVAANRIPQYREILKGLFDITDKSRHTLVAKDILDGDRQWYLTGYPTRLIENSPGIYTITIQIEAPIWSLVTPLTDTWNIVATGATRTITNIGNITALPKYSLTPITAKSSGYKYRRCVHLLAYNEVTMTMPMELSDGGFDTASLVAAGKMLAAGYDLRVWMDGQEVDRWLAGENTATTKIWVNVSLQAAASVEGRLSGALAGSGAVTTITFQDTANGRALLDTLSKARNKVIWTNYEAFTFTDVSMADLQLTGVTRAAKGTNMNTHSDGEEIWWLEHDIYILYGDATAPAPQQDDRNKPMFNLSTSGNYSWVYDTFYDTTAVRPGAWKPEVLKSGTGKSHIFTDDENSYVDPAEALGMAIVGSNSPFDVYKAIGETGSLAWTLYHPAGINAVDYGGKKYAFDLTAWPAIAGFQYLVENVAWVTVGTEVVPVVALVWETFSGTLTLSGPHHLVRFLLEGTINPVQDNLAMVQFTGVTLTVESNPIPIFYIFAEEAICFFDLKLSNTTSVEYVRVKAPVKLGDTLVIDCENKTAYVSDGASINVALSSDRVDWLSLVGTPTNSGASAMRYDDAGTTSLTLVTAHRDRNL
jgi:hypothetical protein